MDLLKAELARKKAEKAAKLPAQGAAASADPKARFVRRGDLAKAAETARLEEIERERKETELKKRKREEENAQVRGQASSLISMAGPRRTSSAGSMDTAALNSSSSSSSTDAHSTDAHSGSSAAPSAATTAAAAAAAAKKKKAGLVKQMSAREVRTRLRQLGKPITLYGETDSERSARLVAAEAEEHNDDFNLGAGHETRNPFLGGRQTAGTSSSGAGIAASRTTVQEIDTAAAAGEQEDEDYGVEEGEGKEDETVSDFTMVRRFFKNLVKQWEEDLNARPDAVKNSAAGKRDTRTQKQSKDYLRPLFKLCKQRAVNPGILANLVKMIEYMKEGEFVRAHDIYMLTAIGNAPWPIGLTMVGIHERSGREKIESKNVAHIMNNESQRKYLVSIKRLMTYLQDKRTDVPPSKKVR